MDNDERPMIHIRLSKRVLRRVDHARIDMEQDRARAIEHLLEIGLEAMEKGEPVGSV